MQILVQDEAQFTMLMQAVTDVNAVNICTAAALTWLLHDIIVTLEQEAQTVWWARWTFTKSAYLFLRYFNIFALALLVAGDTRYDVSLKL
ncbi:hypothetical protein HGRIS_007129 [Hohenbuehelia grisea]|uniref:DUF6533 domain-containing protein n=1 Tax=Hohenbuehelia grisea TaxID=104357 RepID=A0ABR3JB91_9AGAR